MTKIYRTREKEEFEIDQLDSQEQAHLEWLLQAYQEATSWIAFQQRTAPRTIELGKEKNNGNFKDYPLFKIQIDLLANVGIREEEFQKKELSDMLTYREASL